MAERAIGKHQVRYGRRREGDGHQYGRKPRTPEPIPIAGKLRRKRWDIGLLRALSPRIMMMMMMMIEVPNAPFLSMKANFNLNVYERNLLGNDEQIDPDLNLLNDNALDAQYADPNTLMPKIVKFKEMFSVLHINARSISSKMDDLRFMLLKLPVMVL